ncbi:MAG: hypothetical protein U9Q22_04235 [Candidatus Altiarchaeota archaeon]|nr:hypothetical protein [Candidatus Altiarchaeota archaeon]
MFQCPNCKKNIPKWKAGILTNYTTIRCSNCGKLLKGKKETLSKIGIYGALVGLLIWFIFLKQFGIMGFLIVIVLIFLIATLVTISTVELEIVNPDKIKKV